MLADRIESFSHVGGGKGHLPVTMSRAMSVLPLLPLELAAGRVMSAVLRSHPSLLSRLGEHAGKRFAVDPIDCPFAFLLEPRPVGPALRAVVSLQGQTWDARIAAPALVLVGLLDGSYDGDALFFSRDLTIEGDTAAVLALRNAIEDAEIDFAQALGLPEIAAPFVRAGVNGVVARLRAFLGAPQEAPRTAGEP